ncbi:pilus assembly PilX family protein [Microbulbifer variabilis]|uniref:PilX N-terminal domain-containing pilus assembly protein n=1 Tax=Microbulbifer variabilis TaxID=266805 RepID=A0ABY4VCT4_9GAMM|nr:PilX N-terminal domain-containing pilus assembly protein [Microbulbifer variabilis]USD22093.1 PilX N-terminal domain-containing pilus assembly protein [Microbulbifer variabilis]
MYKEISTFKQERGATLLVGLVMLLLMTFIGLAAIRGSGMQELMAGNMRDRQLAFQAAESALRVAEENIITELNKPISTIFDGDTVGYGDELDGSKNSGFWLDFSWSGVSVKADLDLESIASQPIYIVEKVTTEASNTGETGGAIDLESVDKGVPPNYYRITSRGVGGTENTVVILQSTMKD